MAWLNTLGPRLPVDGRLWKWYYRAVGVPSYRSQLLWHYVTRFPKPLHFSSVLDVGCGAGVITVGLALRWPGARFSGVDIYSSSIDLARRTAVQAHADNTEWQVAHFTEFQGGPFDVVISLGLFEFVKDPSVDLARIAGCTRPGGRIIVTTPHARTPDERSQKRHTKCDMHDWMIAAGCENPEIIEVSRGLSHLVYVGSQRLQWNPFGTAAFHLLTFPLVYLDQRLPGSGDLL